MSNPKVTILWADLANHIPKPLSLDHTAVAYGIRITRGKRHRDLVVVHSSGRFDAPAADVAAYLRALRDHYRPDVITTTESEEPQVLATILHAFGAPWQGEKVGEYVCLIDSHSVRFGRLKAHLRRMTRTQGLDDWRNLFIGVFHLRVLGLWRVPLCVTAGHTPAGVEAGTHYDGHVAAVETSVDGFLAWGHFLDSLPRNTVALANMDSNLDQHDAVWRHEIQHDLRAETIWDGPRPVEGSHAGRRLIDTAAVRMGGAA